MRHTRQLTQPVRRGLIGRLRGDHAMTRRLSLIALALCLGGMASAQTSYPMITHVTPVAVQRGKTTEVTVDGQMNFFGVYQALFEGTGVTAEVVTKWPAHAAGTPAPTAKGVVLKLTVAADAA